MENEIPVHYKGDANGSGLLLDYFESTLKFLTDKNIPLGSMLEINLRPPGEIFFLTADSKVISVVGEKNHFLVELELLEGQKGFDKLTSEDEIFSSTKHDTTIRVMPQQVYNTICDFESYPKWQKVVNKVEVLERQNSRPKIVRFTFNFLLRKIVLTNEYFYNDENLILEWKLAEGYPKGDLKRNEGKYVFTETSTGSSAILTMSIVLGFKAPYSIINFLKKTTMYLSVQALKKETERRYL